MDEIVGGTTADQGCELVPPGSTGDGRWEEPLENWGLVFGDPSTAMFLVEGRPDELETLLAKALRAVRDAKAT
jgi:hypothetical protein